MPHKRVYLLYSEFGEIAGFFTNAKKAYNFLKDQKRHVWLNECHYSHFQRIITNTQRPNCWSCMDFQHVKRYYKIVVCHEAFPYDNY